MTNRLGQAWQALGTIFDRWTRRDIGASAAISLLIILFGLVFVLLREAPPAPFGDPPVTPESSCNSTAGSSGAVSAQPVKVSDASGPNAMLDIFVGRGGAEQTRKSASLAIQKGSLCPGGILTASISDLVRDDGWTLPASQVVGWGQVDNAGTHITMWVRVAPRYMQVSGFGDYSGVVTLADRRVLGGNVLLNVHVVYPNVNRTIFVGLLAAFGGFTWAWLVHDLRNVLETRKSHAVEYFWRNFILRIAVLLAAAIPVVNVQVLASPDWEGNLSQFIALATLAGAAAIALTPTLRALALPHGLPANIRRNGRREPPPVAENTGEI